MAEKGQTIPWRRMAFRVDMRPVEEQARWLVGQRLARLAEVVPRYRDRPEDDPHDYRVGDPRKTHEIGMLGEIAVARLLGGTIRIEESRDADVILPSGRGLEVKTTSFRWPFNNPKKPPEMSANPKYAAKRDAVLCVTGSPPTCYEEVWIAGWIEARRIPELAVQKGPKHWACAWSPSSWRSIAEWMQDELHRPRQPIGTPGRIAKDDPGGIAIRWVRR